MDFLIYECNHSPTTVDTTVSQLKVFLKYVFDHLPFIKLHPEHQRIKSNNKPQEKVFLEWEEIERMLVAEGLTDNEAKVRDVYLFTCFTGLRFSDVMGLTSASVVTRTLNGQTIQILSLIQQKTKRRVVVALSEYAVQILEKYTTTGGFLPRFDKSHANRKIFLTLPLLAASALGGVFENCTPDMNNGSGEHYKVLKVDGVNYKNAFVVSIDGNSMEPCYSAGSKVIACPVADGNWQYALGVHAISLKTNMFLIKRIIKIEGMYYTW